MGTSTFSSRSSTVFQPVSGRGAALSGGGDVRRAGRLCPRGLSNRRDRRAPCRRDLSASGWDRPGHRPGRGTAARARRARARQLSRGLLRDSHAWPTRRRPAPPDAAGHTRLELPLLSPEDQAALRCLSIFNGSFTLEDVAFVMGPLIDFGEAKERLTSLIDKSFVVAKSEG